MNLKIAALIFLLIGFGVGAKVMARLAKLMVDERWKQHVQQNPQQGSPPTA
jgi:hypothetical protein